MSDKSETLIIMSGVEIGIQSLTISLIEKTEKIPVLVVFGGGETQSELLIGAYSRERAFFQSSTNCLPL